MRHLRVGGEECQAIWDIHLSTKCQGQEAGESWVNDNFKHKMAINNASPSRRFHQLT